MSYARYEQQHGVNEKTAAECRNDGEAAGAVSLGQRPQWVLCADIILVSVFIGTVCTDFKERRIRHAAWSQWTCTNVRVDRDDVRAYFRSPKRRALLFRLSSLGRPTSTGASMGRSQTGATLLAGSLPVSRTPDVARVFVFFAQPIASGVRGFW